MQVPVPAALEPRSSSYVVHLETIQEASDINYHLPSLSQSSPSPSPPPPPVLLMKRQSTLSESDALFATPTGSLTSLQSDEVQQPLETAV